MSTTQKRRRVRKDNATGWGIGLRPLPYMVPGAERTLI